jgi:hypothetical protein
MCPTVKAGGSSTAGRPAPYREEAGMGFPVSLRRIVEELDALDDEATAYLNPETGEVYIIRDDEAALVEDHVDATWLALPTCLDIHEWAIMDDFVRSVGDPAVRDELRRSVHGRGAFRHSKDSIHRHGIQQDWYDFKTAALERIAIDRLDELGIPYARSSETKKSLYGW